MPTVAEVMAELESLGTEQNRKVYARHGAKEPMFGVSYANLGKLVKKLKKNQALADGLWKTGNHDARVLAAMIAEPELCSKAVLDSWVKGVGCYPAAMALAGVAGQSPDAAKVTEEWTRSPKEFVATSGWDAFARRCGSPDPPSAKECRETLARIEATIHQAPNRARYSMNGAVIAMGCMGGEIGEAAVASARRIGYVDVDHGETGCKTPDAEEHIRKALAYQAARAKGKAAGAAVTESKAKSATARTKAEEREADAKAAAKNGKKAAGAKSGGAKPAAKSAAKPVAKPVAKAAEAPGNGSAKKTATSAKAAAAKPTAAKKPAATAARKPAKASAKK